MADVKMKLEMDLLLVALLSLAGAACALALPDGNIIRTALGIPLLFLFPGYCLVASLWPRAQGPDMLERVGLSIGLSIAITAISGLLISLVTDIVLSTVLAASVGATLLFCVIGHFNRAKVPEEKRFSPDIRSLAAFEGQAERAIAVLLVCGIVVSAGALAYLLATPAPEDAYTQFYLLDSGGGTSNFPVNLTVGQQAVVIIGVTSYEENVTDFTIISGLDNATALLPSNWTAAVAISNSTSTARDITLAQGENFEGRFTFMFMAPGEYRVVWRLQMDGQPTSYEVHRWISVSP